MTATHLLDGNVLIELLRGTSDAALKPRMMQHREELAVSAITISELD
jgi:predicted nucleic acid-binding protein